MPVRAVPALAFLSLLTLLAPPARAADACPRAILPVHVPGAAAARAPRGAHLDYHGGRVVSNVEVVQVLWGAPTSPDDYLPEVVSTGAPSVGSFFQAALNGPYVDWLDREYNTVEHAFDGKQSRQRIGRGRFARQVVLTPVVASPEVDDETIKLELAAQIADGRLPAPTLDANGNPDTYYAIFFPRGTTITNGGARSCAAGGFCAYHGTIAEGPGVGEILYGVHPDMQPGSPCAASCGNASTPFEVLTSVASHELAEVITDPEVGLATTIGPPLGWYDPSEGEIGDICLGQEGTVSAPDGRRYVVQASWSNAAAACTVQGSVAVARNAAPAQPAAVATPAAASAAEVLRAVATRAMVTAASAPEVPAAAPVPVVVPAAPAPEGAPARP